VGEAFAQGQARIARSCQGAKRLGKRHA
jgi:hypothetical protein